MENPTELERAFALAKTGSYVGVGEIRNQLRAEGYGSSQLCGPSITKQIREICQLARNKAPRHARPPQRLKE